MGSMMIKKWHQHNSAQPLKTVYILRSLFQLTARMACNARCCSLVWLLGKGTGLTPNVRTLRTTSSWILHQDELFSPTLLWRQRHGQKISMGCRTGAESRVSWAGGFCWGDLIPVTHWLGRCQRMTLFCPLPSGWIYVNGHPGQVPVFSCY